MIILLVFMIGKKIFYYVLQKLIKKMYSIFHLNLKMSSFLSVLNILKYGNGVGVKFEDNESDGVERQSKFYVVKDINNNILLVVFLVRFILYEDQLVVVSKFIKGNCMLCRDKVIFYSPVDKMVKFYNFKFLMEKSN